ncbi:EAL domain-containing protein [uncultured Clostridium sp.]|uniref:EAL domain-containing protein n=1 Tax=uncultured Clostridium sp. TaxID=59620 RepID=UPI0025F2F0E7|nr:EAL domain-containing protein [uncultured Clostridium sp.]
MIFLHLTLLLLFTLTIHLYIYPLSKRIVLKLKVKYRIKNNRYILNFQPIINPLTNKIISFETLSRLKNRKGEIISPIVFLDEIDRSGMMTDFSLWVLNKAISDYKIIKNYPNMKNNKFYLSINISPKDLENSKFINSLLDLSGKMKKNTICLEITENKNITNFNKIQESINILKSAGYLIALDDFGAHYSNLDLLESLDYDILKLDKQFLDNIPNSKFNQEILKFVSKMCTIQEKQLVIEGLETKEQKNYIMNILNDNFYFQGFFYSKPVLLNDIKNLYFT